MAFRCSAVSLAALANPPFLPPSFPRATAAGFFSFSGLGGLVLADSASGTTVSRICRASWNGSLGVFLLGRLGTPGFYAGIA